ncbi:hypothetical protein BOTCAL_0272g00020 [Botryotinia calthae]|uniref:Nephrocystin 3-like N-terminal domain-containing protein n=1 Tax=Botryotinia calthae TaxID=38488 RepID=A0A4Y8CWA2_9HELO|nr:hypothetical protein BOTCAL_0272g00020 [Botryotinia calthae]
MGSKSDHSGHSWQNLKSRFKRFERHQKKEKTKHESDRPKLPDDSATSGDPWTDAFKELSPQLQEKFRARGMVDNRTLSMRDKVEEFKQEAGRLQELSNERDWKFSMKGQEILVRDLTTRVVGWAIKIGDIAMPLAPTSPAAAVWGCSTIFLKGIQNFDAEKRALLSIAEKVAQAMFLGQLYSNIYTQERTGDSDVIANLRKATVDVYVCVLTLLAKSFDLSSNTVTQFCRSMFEDHKPSGILSDLATQKSALDKAAGLCEVTAKALQDKDFRNLLQATELFQRQYFQTINENDQRNIRDWVSKVPYASHRRNIEERRKKDTGDWLIQHEEFLDWILSPSSKVLWLQGSQAGTGKTFLTANVVTYLENRIASTGGGLAYFFCNRDEDDRRSSSPILRSLVRQLATTSSMDKSIRGSLHRLWKKSMKDNLDFGRSDCQSQLSESFDTYSTTFVVLDALDEVNKEDLRIILEDIRNTTLKTENIVKLFVASRPEIDIPYNPWPTVTIQARDNFEDIKKYVEGEVEKFIDDFHYDRPVEGSAVMIMKTQIIGDILGKCDNMFLWAALHVKRILLDCRTVDGIKDALENLPMGLDKTYDRFFKGIKQSPIPEQELVEHTLKWVYAAPGLLQTDEILSAIRVRVKDGNLTFINSVNKETLLLMCSSLLIVDSEDQWRFCHLSVREYLNGYMIEPTGKWSDPSSFCAEICFRTLLLSFNPQDTVFAQADPTEEENHDRLKNPFHPANPFSRHCQLYWIFYAKTKVAKSSHIPLLKRFLGSPNEASPFYLRWFDYAVKFSSKKYERFSTPFVSDYETTFNRWLYRDGDLPKAPIFLVAYFALYKPLREWCESSDISPLQSTKNGDYLLTVALKSSCVPLCSALIEKGRCLDEELQLCLSQALVAAADQGNKEMAEYLIGEGADARLLPEPKGTLSYYGPVDAAARRGDLNLVTYFMEKANAVIGDALFWAAEPESKEAGLGIIKYLIEYHKADPNLPPKRHRYQSAFVVAAVFCRHDIIKYYLEETNVDLNAEYRSGSYASPLCAMMRRGLLEDVKYLVKGGNLEVNRPHEFVGDGSALAEAVSLGKLEIVKYLVEEAGADPDLELKVGLYGNALTTAIASREHRGTEIIKYLLPLTQVNLPLSCGVYGSALAAAFELKHPASKVDMNIVRLLIKAGADVNLQHQTGNYGSPFVAAAFFVEDLDIINYLVDECKAKIDALHSTGDYGSALVAAANGGNLGVVRYLVESGVDPDCELQSGAYGSALAAAADGRWSDSAVLEYLVNLGLNTNRELQVGIYGSALVSAATATHRLYRVKCLVEKGKANVDLCLRSGSFGNSLTAAAAKRNFEGVKYLVAKGGANVNLPLGYGSLGSALHAAIISPFDFPIDQSIIEFWLESSPEIDLARHRHILGDDVTRVVLSATFANAYWREGALRIVKFLVNTGANVDLELQVGTYGNALAAAVVIGSLDQVKYLVREGGANANSQLNTGSFGSALVISIIAHSKLRNLHADAILDSIQKIIRSQLYRMDYSNRPPRRTTAGLARSLVDSTMSSLVEIMIFLLESGSDANLQLTAGPFGSALAAAAATGSFWHVKFLVENAQADVSLQLNHGSYANAYEAAVAHEHHEIAKYLASNAGGH